MSRARKGIILAGGAGSRLHPITLAVSKQLLPIYDKPMIYYPLSTLMLAGIREIRVITTPHDCAAFMRALGDGAQWGLQISYGVQEQPEGIAQAFLLAADFIDGCSSALILGDNIFQGPGWVELLTEAATQCKGASLFASRVMDPQRYGVIEFDRAGDIVSIVEKPNRPRSRWAVTGLYFYDSQVVDIAATLSPSARGELEITDVNLAYFEMGTINAHRLPNGFAWLDTGTPESLAEAVAYVRTLEKRTGLRICCPEEIAFRLGWISVDELARLGRDLNNCDYGRYLEQVANENGDNPG